MLFTLEIWGESPLVFEQQFLADKTCELNARLQFKRVFLPVNKPGRV